ncbi:MAG TPA: MFS transporter [Acidimicrobiales bacterium]|nr:MFS transporter [Acidimicrobiales bacterium]
MTATSITERTPGSTARADDGKALAGRFPQLRRLVDNPSVFLFVILTAQLMVVLDATIVNVALPHIQRGLGFSGSGLSWVLNAYILTFGGLLLLGARSGDIVGRRRTFLVGIAIFSLSSLAGGFAVTSWMLLAARALQGTGAALAAPSSLALLTAVFPEGQQRMRAIGLFTAVSAAGGAIGLLAGGMLTEWASWRWVMFVNVPIGLAVWSLGRVVIPETGRRHGRFDISGAVMSTVGMSAVVLGLVEAGSKGWAQPITISSFAGGVILLAAFVQNERRASEPILPLRLLADGTRTGANLARGLVYAGMYGMFFFLSQFLQDVQGHSPLVTGAGFLPVPISIFLASQLTSKVLVRRFPAKAVMLSGVVLAMVALVLTSRLQVGSSYSQVLIDLVLLGFGSGTSLVSMTSAALSGVEPRDAGAASGLVNVIQQIGAALGLAVLVTVFDAATGHAQLGTSTAATASAGAASASHALASAALVHGLDEVFRVAALFGFLALLTVTFVIRTGAAAPRPENTTATAVAKLGEIGEAGSLEGLEGLDGIRGLEELVELESAQAVALSGRPGGQPALGLAVAVRADRTDRTDRADRPGVVG